MNKALVDSSFLYILLNTKHKEYKRIASAIKPIHQLIVPYVVLTEVAYLFNRDGGTPAMVKFLDQLAQIKFTYEAITAEDFVRIRKILTIYHDAKFDFVDCCLMALAERHQISTICTLDQRDFAIFRPNHIPQLDLLP